MDMETRLSKAALLVLVLSSVATALQECPENPDIASFVTTFSELKRIALEKIDDLVNMLVLSQWASSLDVCMNGGTPENVCNCASGFAGTMCETEPESVSSSSVSCLNGGTPTQNGCHCASGYSGTMCETGCLDTPEGDGYIGTKNMTGNAQCLRWDTVHHSKTPDQFPGDIQNLSQAENYCRNPGNGAFPWCYVNDTTTMVPVPTHCVIPHCHSCLSEDLFYDGMQSKTTSGLTCQRWDKQSPHAHTVTDPTKFRIASGQMYTQLKEAENYCRVVDGFNNRSTAWCFTNTSTIEWEYCNVSCGY